MTKKTEYGGFWIRLGAMLLDTLLFMLISAPLFTLIYGTAYWSTGSMMVGVWDILIGYVLPVVIVIVFWIYKSATPGKMATSLKIVDARTGGHPTTGQFILRYFGYILSTLPLFLGFIWVAFDKRKQGFHDKLARTVVIREIEEQPEDLFD